mgnify:FL=1
MVFSDISNFKLVSWDFILYDMAVNKFLESINCVPWNPSGSMVASASDEQTAKLLDVNGGKILYTETTPGKHNWQSNYHYNNNHNLIIKMGNTNVLHLDQ